MQDRCMVEIPRDFRAAPVELRLEWSASDLVIRKVMIWFMMNLGWVEFTRPKCLLSFWSLSVSAIGCYKVGGLSMKNEYANK